MSHEAAQEAAAREATDSLTIGETEIPYEVRFSPKARHKRLVVTPGHVEVVAPEGTPRSGRDGVEEFVDSKRRWLYDAVREIETKHKKLLTQRYASGAKLQYRGRWLMLDVQSAKVDAVEIQCRSKFHVSVPLELQGVQRLEAVRRAFDQWLRKRAQRDLGTFVRRHESNLGVTAQGFRLSESKSRWGSLGRDGVVRIHWRLVQAPKKAMEYVAAHEVAHLLHRNHSPEFWHTLTETLPEWPEAKKLLEDWEEGHRAV